MPVTIAICFCGSKMWKFRQWLQKNNHRYPGVIYHLINGTFRLINLFDPLNLMDMKYALRVNHAEINQLTLGLMIKNTKEINMKWLMTPSSVPMYL